MGEDHHQRRGPSLTIGRLFTLLLITLCLFYVMAAIIMYWRLTDVDNMLQRFKSDNVPAVFDSSQLFRNANLLLYSVQELSDVTSDAARRISNDRLTARVRELTEVQGKVLSQDHQLQELQIIKQEIDRLNVLIDDKIGINRSLTEQRLALAELMTILNQLAINNQNTANAEQLTAWSLKYAQAVTVGFEALAVTKLTTLRGAQGRIEQLFLQMTQLKSGVANGLKQQMDELNNTLDELLFASTGLIDTKAAYLKAKGRAKGQSNFVLNLIYDYTRTVEEVAFNRRKDAVQRLTTVEQQIQSQSVMLLVFLALTMASLLFAVYVINRRVVRRLFQLNTHIVKQSGSDTGWQADQINDEIGELSRTLLAYHETIAAQKQALHDLSMTDGLTAIANRRHFDFRLDLDLAQARRQKSPLSVLLIDVDFFKLFNDNYGHLAGDEALKSVAQALTTTLQRDQDLAARYGGEEFACILPDTDERGALFVAQSILNSICDLAITHEYSDVSEYLTCSIGVVTWNIEDTEGHYQLLEHADTALYYVKQHGRNNAAHFIDVQARQVQS